MSGRRLNVEVVSDVMCPWCYIGKRRLEAALADAGLPVDIAWRPFQLDPTLPAEGKDRRAYLAHRNANRRLYSRGYWRAPFAYRTFRPGLHIGTSYYSPRYYVANPYQYRLPYARPGLRWIRHYDDVLLVDVRRGIVVDVIRNFYW